MSVVSYYMLAAWFVFCVALVFGLAIWRAWKDDQ